MGGDTNMAMQRVILARLMCCVRGCSAMGSRTIREDQGGLRVDGTALPTPVHPICASGRNSSQPALLIRPIVLSMDPVNEYSGSKSSKTYAEDDNGNDLGRNGFAGANIVLVPYGASLSAPPACLVF